MLQTIESDEKQRLPDLCADSIMLIMQLRSTAELGDEEVLRRRIKDLLDRLEREAKKNGIEFDEVQSVKFALVAFIDEALIGSNWAQKDAWLANPLQMELFNRFDAGEEFFVKLEQLRQRAQANADVLLVYYLVLVLGFKGKYHFDESGNIRMIIEDTYNDLRRTTSVRSDTKLAPHGLRRDEIVEAVNEIPAWVIGVTAASLAFFFFLIMSWLISGSAEDVTRAIEQVV